MAITKFVRVKFDRAVQEELFDIKFIGFGEAGFSDCFFTKYRDM